MYKLVLFIAAGAIGGGTVVVMLTGAAKILLINIKFTLPLQFTYQLFYPS